jgi:hypothetical protein
MILYRPSLFLPWRCMTRLRPEWTEQGHLLELLEFQAAGSH